MWLAEIPKASFGFWTLYWMFLTSVILPAFLYRLFSKHWAVPWVPEPHAIASERGIWWEGLPARSLTTDSVPYHIADSQSRDACVGVILFTLSIKASAILELLYGYFVENWLVLDLTWPYHNDWSKCIHTYTEHTRRQEYNEVRSWLCHPRETILFANPQGFLPFSLAIRLISAET